MAIIAVRELGIQAFRSYWGRRAWPCPPRTLAKAKTVVQEVAVGFALLPLTADRRHLGGQQRAVGGGGAHRRHGAQYIARREPRGAPASGSR